MINERSVEIPALLNFVQQRRNNIESLLDIGCALNEYGGDLSQLLKQGTRYDGCDLVFDSDVAPDMREYYIGDVRELDMPMYDCVISISTIEHVGMKPVQVDAPEIQQYNFFHRINRLSRKYMFVTFLFGSKGMYEKEYSSITGSQLDAFLGLVNGEAITRFYYSENPPMGALYQEVSRREAMKVELNKELGAQCVCLLGVDKCQGH